MSYICNQVRFRLFIALFYLNMAGKLILHHTNAFCNMRNLSLTGNRNIRVKITCGNLFYRLCQGFYVPCRSSLQKQKTKGEKNNSQKYKEQNADHSGKGETLYHGMVIPHLIKIARVGADVENQKTFHYTRKNSRHPHMEKNLHHISSTEMVRRSFLIHLKRSYFSIL